MRLFSSRGWFFGLGSAVGAALIITALAILPALGSLGEGISTFTGTGKGAVVTATNGGNGASIEGVTGATAGGQAVFGIANNGSNQGIAVHGETFGPSSTAVFGEAAGFDPLHPSVGVFGYSVYGNGVYAFTKLSGPDSLVAKNPSTGNAVFAESAESSGVLGRTDDATFGGSAGVAGVDNQTTLGSNFAGLFTSTLGRGVYGLSQQNDGGSFHTGASAASDGSSGVYATDDSTSGQTNFGIFASTVRGTGVEGISAGVGAGNLSAGVLGITNACSMTCMPGVGVWGRDTGGGNTGVMGETFTGTAMAGRSLGSGNTLRLVGTGTTSTCTSTTLHDVLSVDNAGNVLACGGITANHTPLFITRTAAGANLASYGARTSQPTIEDLGEAQLVNGQAYVRIDPAFGASIDRHANYLVFITAQGDTQGWLYAVQKTPAGFAVREHEGHSSVVFDYRIVAKPVDSNAPRLALILPHATPVTHAKAIPAYVAIPMHAPDPPGLGARTLHTLRARQHAPLPPMIQRLIQRDAASRR